ncbi:MAG TPA: hypothetical protein VGT98_03715, partial [Candidatus Elarobacter sp.]|nr:hypothetical protein [Candidatus Elarobacter sp.]
RTRPSSLPIGLVSPGACTASYNEITKTSGPTGASIATVDVPPAVLGLFANVTGPGGAASGFTSIATLSVDGETKCRRRAALGARSGHRIVKLTRDRAAADGWCTAGTVRAPLAHPLVASSTSVAAAVPRALT